MTSAASTGSVTREECADELLSIAEGHEFIARTERADLAKDAKKGVAPKDLARRVEAIGRFEAEARQYRRFVELLTGGESIAALIRLAAGTRAENDGPGEADGSLSAADWIVQILARAARDETTHDTRKGTDHE